MYQVNGTSVVFQILQIWECAIDGFAHFQERSDAKFETLMVIVFQRGRGGSLVKHYVCEVIRIFARSTGLAGPIVSVLVLAGEACETLLPIVFQS